MKILKTRINAQMRLLADLIKMIIFKAVIECKKLKELYTKDLKIQRAASGDA